MPDLRVKVGILDRSTAFLGILEGFVTRAAEVGEVKRGRMRTKMRTAKGGNFLRTLQGVIMAARGRISSL